MSRRTPHDTEPVSDLWTAWPHHPDWGAALTPAREEIAALAQALAGGGPQAFAAPEFALDAAVADGLAPRGGIEPALVAARAPAAVEPARKEAPPPQVRVLARNADHSPAVRALEEKASVGRSKEAGDNARPPQVETARFGDIWLRDTGPVFTLTADGPRALAFRFNGWGGKYRYADDDKVAAQIARTLDIGLEPVDMVCEGGAIETDGEGTAIVTRSCLLDRGRNPSFDASDAARVLRRALGLERLIWLDQGLANDHTDGHADTLARFVRPGLVVCQAPFGADDPNAATLDAVARTLDRARDAHGRPIDVVRVPSPGLVIDDDDRPAPASHMNFVHAGGRVIVPTYGAPSSDVMVRGLGRVFEDREVLPLPAEALIAGGGAFHCVTCAAPAAGARL